MIMTKVKIVPAGKSYCPHCCVIEYRTRPIKVRVSSIFGLFPRIETHFEEYLYKTPIEDYPDSYDKICGDTISHHCERCDRLLSMGRVSFSKWMRKQEKIDAKALVEYKKRKLK